MFTVQSTHLLKTLHIQVEPLSASGVEKYLAQCKGAKNPVRGLGNEAFVCRMKAKHKTTAVRLAGRVRNHVFVVDVRTNDRRARAEALIDIAKESAEEVAGDLF